ncbi:MAG: hypothetical protein ABI411_10290 [Tahibacter sp.]
MGQQSANNPQRSTNDPQHNPNQGGQGRQAGQAEDSGRNDRLDVNRSKGNKSDKIPGGKRSPTDNE